MCIRDSISSPFANQRGQGRQSLATFLVGTIQELAKRSGTCTSAATLGHTERECPDTLAIRGVEAGLDKLHLNLKWCGQEREMIYFLQDPSDPWPHQHTRVNVVIDVGPNSTPLSAYANHLAPVPNSAAVLLATADDYDARFHPFFSRVEKPPTPVPGIVQELRSTPAHRFQCLRALLQPELYRVADESSM